MPCLSVLTLGYAGPERSLVRAFRSEQKPTWVAVVFLGLTCSVLVVKGLALGLLDSCPLFCGRSGPEVLL